MWSGYKSTLGVIQRRAVAGTRISFSRHAGSFLGGYIRQGFLLIPALREQVYFSLSFSGECFCTTHRAITLVASLREVMLPAALVHVRCFASLKRPGLFVHTLYCTPHALELAKDVRDWTAMHEVLWKFINCVI